MKTLLATLLALVTVLAVPIHAEIKKAPPAKAPAGIKYEGGDGSSMEKAVIIKGAKGEDDGVKSEYAWLAKKYPGYKAGRQALLGGKGKNYDLISIVTADGKMMDVCFDITDYFGK